MAATFDNHTERADPFHSQNAPHHQRLSSRPFNGRLTINPEACGKKERKSLVANQRIWLGTREGRNTLVVVTDGSLTNVAAGWAVTGIHAGRTLFEYKVPLAKRAGNHDAEMMALSHASKLIYQIMLGELHIREFRIFSDSTSALTSIFDPGPHAAQQASLVFRKNMIRLFTFRPDITGSMVWTPGHAGLDQMKTTDKNARTAANMKCRDSGYLLPHFVSRSSALAEVETMALKEWNTFLDDLEDSDKKIFRAESGFLPFARARKTSDFLKLKPPKWFKKINRSSMSTLTQMCTNHAPTGEYFKSSVWKYQNKPPSFFFCPCHKSKDHNYPPVLQTRDHIIRACPLFEDAREKLAVAFPGIRMPRRSLGRLIKKKCVEDTLEFLKSGAFSRHHAPYEPP